MTDRLLFSLPVRMGGLNIHIPTQILSDSMKGSLPFSIADHDSSHNLNFPGQGGILILNNCRLFWNDVTLLIGVLC